MVGRPHRGRRSLPQHPVTTRIAPEGGFATPVLTLVLAALILALAGMSVDLWRVASAHQRLVAATDAAAIAGAGGIDIEQLYLGVAEAPVLDRDAATDLACAYLTSNVSIPICPGPDAAVVVEAEAITVSTRMRVPLSLLRLLLLFEGRSEEIEVTATATAVPVRLFSGEP